MGAAMAVAPSAHALLTPPSLRPSCGDRVADRAPSPTAHSSPPPRLPSSASLLVGAGLTCGVLAHRRRGRAVARTSKTLVRVGGPIDLFKVFGPEEDPFEIETESVLGVGAQGTVFRCHRRSAPLQALAVKAVPVWRLQNDPESESKLAALKRETEALLRVQGHENVAECLGCWDVPHPFGKDSLPNMYTMMVTELVPGGELAGFISQRGGLDEATARSVFRQTVAGLKFLHSKQVLHRDLKCENILVCSEELSPSSRVKLIDFGVAKSIAASVARSCVGTREIMAPELVCAKLMIAPKGMEMRLHGPVTFQPPQQASPGFGLASARPDGSGAIVNGITPGGQAELNGVGDGWAVTSINGIDIREMPFVPDAGRPQEPCITGILGGLSSDFKAEFAELPKRQFGEAIDLWSLGVVLFTMLAGRAPFTTEEEIVSGEYPSDCLANVSPEGRDLIQGLLRLNPGERMTIAQVEAHPWHTASN